ncbi:MAG: sulfotransferase family protein [Anaerolineales bacterium]|nr:MAG: sulfotransferase family protein [Anaerolineales bacterium]
MGFFRRVFQSKARPVVVVSGLPRSGTSMMMRMLDMGGLPVLVDHIRKPNEDNPQGYYEFERVKKMPEGDFAWLQDAQAHAVKVLAVLLTHLPDKYTYKVLFMRRNMQEMLDSQHAMLVRRGEVSDRVDDREMARLFEKHLQDLYTWMDGKSNVQYFEVDYNAVLENPSLWAQRVQQFLGMELNVQAMTDVVDAALYRQHR